MNRRATDEADPAAAAGAPAPPRAGRFPCYVSSQATSIYSRSSPPLQSFCSRGFPLLGYAVPPPPGSPARDPGLAAPPLQHEPSSRRPPDGDGDPGREDPRPGLADRLAVLLVGMPNGRPGLPARCSSWRCSPSPSPPRSSRSCWSLRAKGSRHGAATPVPGGAAAAATREGGLSTKAKVLIGLGIYLAVAILLLLIFGNDGKNEAFKPQNEFKLEPWSRSSSAASTSASTRRSSTSSSPAP